MRRVLEVVSFLVLLSVWAITTQAVFGAHPVPARIPIHFDPGGRPNGWAGRAVLWVQPAIAAGVYLLMTLVARFSTMFNFRNVRPGARRELESIALSMMSWLKVEILALLAAIQYLSIELARRGQGPLSPWFIPLMILIVFGTVAWHTIGMRRAGRG